LREAGGVSQEDGEQFPDGRFAGAGLGQRQVGLDLVVVASAVFRLGHVASLDKVGEDAVGSALGDAQTDSDVAQAQARVVSDAQQNAGMAGQEAPLRHRDQL
jgi:hypothetical protein